MLSELSVVVPCYKSGRELEALVEQLLPAVQDQSEKLEILFVDDGSPDDSWIWIKELTTRFPYLRGIRLSRNMGQHAATLAGLHEATYNLILTMDDDLQNPPSQIELLIDELEKNPELGVVYGVPIEKQHEGIRRVGSKFFRTFLKALGMPIADMVSSFRLIRRERIDNLNAISTHNTFLDLLFVRNKMICTFVPVKHNERLSGSSSYSFSQLAKLALSCWQATLSPVNTANVTETYTIKEQCSSPEPPIC